MKYSGKGHKPTVIASSKEVNQCVEKKLKEKPASNHPWRQAINVETMRKEEARQ